MMCDSNVIISNNDVLYYYVFPCIIDLVQNEGASSDMPPVPEDASSGMPEDAFLGKVPG